MKHYSPTGRRTHGRPLKRLLGKCDRNGSTSGPTSWQIYDDDYYYYYYYLYYRLLSQAFSSWYFSLTSGDPQPLRLQVSDCSTFRIMRDVPSIAVFCSESIECFPGTTFKFFLKLLVNIPVAPIIIGIIIIIIDNMEACLVPDSQCFENIFLFLKRLFSEWMIPNMTYHLQNVMWFF